MSSFTVHDLDPLVARLLKERAKTQGASINRTIKRILEEALGVRPSSQSHRKHFEKLSGKWSKAEARAFEREIADMDVVDPADWR